MNTASAPPCDTAHWLEALLAVARHYRLDCAEEQVRVADAWDQALPLDTRIERMARQLGLACYFVPASAQLLDPWRLPLVVDLGPGRVGVVEAIDTQGQASVRLAGEGGLLTPMGQAELLPRVQRALLAKPASAVPDARVDDYIKPSQPNWFWQLALRDWPRYADVMLATLVANVLALASMLFSMQVYDRVVPAQSLPTLWVLFGGALLAIGFECAMRMARAHISDLAGKRADLRISDRVFGHALRIRNDARPASTGSFIAQLRELEQIREMITSTTVGSLADLPFFLLFTVVLWLVGGALVLVPLAALPLLILPGWLLQKPLARLSSEGMRESALRNAILVESIQGVEDIKLLRAEARFQNQWNHCNEVAGEISLKQRTLSTFLATWSQAVQSLVYVLVLLAGAYMVIAGDLTTGALVGTSILSSRMMAPLAQVSGIMARWQQARVAREGLEQLMARPVDQPEHSRRVHRPALHGSFSLQDLRFRYSSEDRQPALDIGALNIAAGEKIAVLGRNGAGKSTLLQLLAGMQLAQEGKLLLDGLQLGLIDPSDVRRDVALLNQNASLFYGSLRDNLALGMPQASDDDMLRALQQSGALGFVQALPDGLDHQLREGGRGLSGGQRQALLLARTLLRNPAVVLLDEPTAWMDEASERDIIEQMQPWLSGRTLVVATHRLSILRWVDRVLILDGGRIVTDGGKEALLQRRAGAAA